MNYNEIYQAVEQDYGHEVALLTIQMLTIQMSTKIKNIETHCVKVENKINRTLWECSSSADYELALKCWKVSYEWDIGQSLEGLGGCTKKTFKELIGKAEYSCKISVQI